MSAALPKVPALKRTISQWLTISLMLALGIYFLIRLVATRQSSLWFEGIYGSLALASGSGLLLGSRWGVWLGMATYLSFGCYFAFLLASREWNWLWLALGLASVFAAREVRVDFRSLLRPDLSGDAQPMVSIVLWLSEPLPLSSRTIAKYLSKAWGVEFTDAKPVESADPAENKTPQPYVAGSTPLFIASDQQAMLVIHHRAEPYFSDPKKVAKDCPNLRLAQLISEHRAWISIDVMSVLKEDLVRESYYPRMARFIAELDHSACLAIYLPQSNQCLPWNDGVKAALRSADPLDALQGLSPGPVIQVDNQDERMKAAVEMARSRWPEFVEAFGHRTPDQLFAIKFPLTSEGATEFIWVNVSAIEGDHIRGTLGNAPVALPGYQEGDAVEVNLKDLNDWMFTLDDGVAGGFTTQVLLDAAKK